MGLLYLQLGYSALIGAAICIILMIPLQFWIGKKMSLNSREMMVSQNIFFSDCLLFCKISETYAHWPNCLSFSFKIRPSTLKMLTSESFQGGTWGIN